MGYRGLERGVQRGKADSGAGLEGGAKSAKSSTKLLKGIVLVCFSIKTVGPTIGRTATVGGTFIQSNC